MGSDKQLSPYRLLRRRVREHVSEQLSRAAQSIALFKKRVDRLRPRRDFELTRPEWYRPPGSDAVEQVQKAASPVFLYIPWIEQHGNALIARLRNDGAYTLLPFEFCADLGKNRLDIMYYAGQYPDLFKSMLYQCLTPLAGAVAAMIFTVDWNPVMRLAGDVCRDLDIPRVLIPHEGVFANPELYYSELSLTMASTPNADLVLAWNDIQKDIFTRRGYPAERILPLGAPKFDAYANQASSLSREQYARILGLNPSRKTILFAAQILDKQFGDIVEAQAKQEQAIRDVFSYAAKGGHNFVLRVPPVFLNAISADLLGEVRGADFAFVDGTPFFRVSPEDAVRHADVVVSINSTMLFEAFLAGRPAFSIRYVNFRNTWERFGIPTVDSREGMFAMFDSLFAADRPVLSRDRSGIDAYLSPNTFDGRAGERISACLGEIAGGKRAVRLRAKPVERVINGLDDGLDVLAVPYGFADPRRECPLLTEMLGANFLFSPHRDLLQQHRISAADLLVLWGTPKNGEVKERKITNAQLAFARSLGIDRLFVDHGLIGTAAGAAESCSIIMDDLAQPLARGEWPRLEKLLADGPELTEEQRARSRSLIERMARNGIGKYSGLPDWTDGTAKTGRKRLLVIADGKEEDGDFGRMAQDVLALPADWEVLLLRTRQAGGAPGSVLERALEGRAKAIDCTVNPQSLFRAADEVWTAASILGFEALWSGCTVRCYGRPFFSGWGLTQDVISERRFRTRSLEEVFYIAYFQLSRYIFPNVKKYPVRVEELIRCFEETCGRGTERKT